MSKSAGTLTRISLIANRTGEHKKGGARKVRRLGKPPRWAGRLQFGQRLFEVGLNVGEVLDAEREAHEVGRDTGGNLFVG